MSSISVVLYFFILFLHCFSKSNLVILKPRYSYLFLLILKPFSGFVNHPFCPFNKTIFCGYIIIMSYRIIKWTYSRIFFFCFFFYCHIIPPILF